jgi:hypothetical protein
VTSIEIHVASLYKASSDSVAITEVELFTKKSAAAPSGGGKQWGT